MTKTLQELLDSMNNGSEPPSPWDGAQNEWVKRLSNHKKGQLAVALYRCLHGGEVTTNPGAGDIRNGQLLVEAKLSTRSYSQANGYTWNQVRPNDAWTHLLLVAVDLASVRAFLIPRARIRPGELRHQHGGALGNDTFLIKTSSRTPIPRWLLEFEEAASLPSG
jgi:hypothetical protein